MTERTTSWSELFQAKKDRLREPLWWFPFPMLISFGFVMLLTSHVIFSANSRAGHPAEVVSFPSEERKDGPLWLAVAPIDDDIVVSTADRKVFRWKQSVRSLEEIQPLVSYLQETVRRELEAAALINEAYSHQTHAVIAADQRLKYLHVRPILYALAKAGIAHYAFETQNPHLPLPFEQSTTTPQAFEATHHQGRM